MGNKSIAQRLIEFGMWLGTNVPPFLTGPLGGKLYAECQALEPLFDGYMATHYSANGFSEADIVAFQDAFVFPA